MLVTLSTPLPDKIVSGCLKSEVSERIIPFWSANRSTSITKSPALVHQNINNHKQSRKAIKSRLNQNKSLFLLLVLSRTSASLACLNSPYELSFPVSLAPFRVNLLRSLGVKSIFSFFFFLNNFYLLPILVIFYELTCVSFSTKC